MYAFLPVDSVVTDKDFFNRFYLGRKAEHSYDITGKDFCVAIRDDNSTIPED